ncbi:MAG: histidine phosphatase family protein [Proteobacteria bacterium]|nr:histidine phosphatase family protein [Pseudomonadota bacterium]
MQPRKVFILRHAEAAPAADDFERPLTAKGIADMKAMARRLEEDGLCPDLVLCSPAKRTRMTLENLLPRVSARFPDRLYNADAGTHYEAVKGVDDSIGSVMIIAHNPGVFNFVRFLAAPGPDVPAGYAPGTLTVLECAVGRWTDLMPGENRVLKVLTV